jgi:hypothetical protein
MLWGRYVGDRKSRRLGERLRNQADFVVDPQRSRITGLLTQTAFVSHTSKDHETIVTDVLPVIHGVYRRDPFFHSYRTGGAVAYERIVGLALLSASKVLSIWSANAASSDYFLAEQQLAFQLNKSVIAFCLGGGERLNRRMLGSARAASQRTVIVASQDMQLALQDLHNQLIDWQT